VNDRQGHLNLGTVLWVRAGLKRGRLARPGRVGRDRRELISPGLGHDHLEVLADGLCRRHSANRLSAAGFQLMIVPVEALRDDRRLHSSR